jgi:hypothetical protein
VQMRLTHCALSLIKYFAHSTGTNMYFYLVSRVRTLVWPPARGRYLDKSAYLSRWREFSLKVAELRFLKPLLGQIEDFRGIQLIPRAVGVAKAKIRIFLPDFPLQARNEVGNVFGLTIIQNKPRLSAFI